MLRLLKRVWVYSIYLSSIRCPFIRNKHKW